MFGEENDLTDVLRIVRHLPIQRLQHGMRLAANSDGAHDVFRPQRIHCREHPLPSPHPTSASHPPA